MNKARLAEKIADNLNLSKKEAEDFLIAFQAEIIKALQNDEEVTISGFGTFSSRVRHARKGVNPRNPSQIIDIPAVKVPKFKAGKKLKDEVKSSLAATSPSEPEPTSTASSHLDQGGEI